MKKLLPILFFFVLSFVSKAQILPFSNGSQNAFYAIGGYSFTQRFFQGGIRPNPDVVPGPSPQNDFTYTVTADGGIQHVYNYISTLAVNKNISFQFKSNNVRKFGCKATAVNISTGQATSETILFTATTNLGNTATQTATLTDFMGFSVIALSENEYLVSVVASFVNPSTNSIAINSITVGDDNPQNVALNFDGVDDYVQIPNSIANFGSDQNFTVTLWVRPNAVQTANAENQNDIISKWNGLGNGNYPFVVRYLNQSNADAGKILVGQYDGTNYNYTTSTNSINDGKWHYIAFVKNGTTFSLYMDGFLDKTFTDNVNLSTTNLTPLYIGRRGNNANYFKGDIDEVKIWNIAKTATEILNERACKIATTTNLVAGFNFNEGVSNGNNILLSQVNNYAGADNGILNNFTETGTTSNFVTGKIIYVKPVATGTGDGSSWANAFTLRILLSGLNSAQCLDNVEVWIAQGIHKPAVNDINATFNIPSGIQIYGGFAGTESTINERNMALIHSTNKTTLSGDLMSNDMPFDFSSNPSNRTDNVNYVVSIGANNVVFDGFTVRGGKSCGAYINGLNASIKNSKFIDNVTGLYGFGNNTSISNCSFMGSNLRGIEIYNANTNIKESLVANNGNTGIYTVAENDTYQITITNCTIAANAGYGIGSLTASSGTSLNNIIKNTIINGNFLTGIYSNNGGTITNTITNSLVQGQTNTANGNLLGTTNPQFVNSLANNVRSDAGDYRLQDSSPCINVGTDVGVSPFDLDRNLRPQGGKTDMGAYESNINMNEIISKATGNWETNTTWNLERLPLPTDKVILNGHQVTVTTNAARAKNLEYKTGAILRYLAGGLLRFGL